MPGEPQSVSAETLQTERSCKTEKTIDVLERHSSLKRAQQPNKCSSERGAMCHRATYGSMLPTMSDRPMGECDIKK